MFLYRTTPWNKNCVGSMCDCVRNKNNNPRTCEMQNGEEHTKEKIHTTQKFAWFTTWATSTELQRSFTIK